MTVIALCCQQPSVPTDRGYHRPGGRQTAETAQTVCQVGGGWREAGIARAHLQSPHFLPMCPNPPIPGHNKGGTFTHGSHGHQRPQIWTFCKFYPQRYANRTGRRKLSSDLNF